MLEPSRKLKRAICPRFSVYTSPSKIDCWTEGIRLNKAVPEFERSLPRFPLISWNQFGGSILPQRASCELHILSYSEAHGRPGWISCLPKSHRVLSFHLDVTIQLDVYIEKIKLWKRFLTSLLRSKIALSVVKPKQSAWIKTRTYK
jgi:hypothetical protein